MMLPKSSQWGPFGYKWLVWLLLVQSLTASISFGTRADSGSPPPNYLDKLWCQVVPGVWYTTTQLSQNPPIIEEPQVMGASPPTPSLFHPLASVFLLSYLGAYFMLGRFNSLLGQYRLIGELFHMGMVSVPIGTLITGLNPSAAIHLLGGMFLRRWVPDKDSTFSILGHSVPIFYHGNKPKNLPIKKVHYINMEYANGDMPVVYTLQQRKINVLLLATKEYKGIPLYSSSKFSIPSGSQVIQNTGLCLSFPKGFHGEVSGLHNGAQLKPWILPGIVMPLLEEILVFLGNLSDKVLKVRKHQLLVYMKLEENSSLIYATPFGEFSEFALLYNQPSILLLILRESLNGLTEDQKDQAI
ncbi:hypothetical protein DSO57_1005192 [Entomophthora muscae]|uniref:Uncharacterized protein n=1 Tax=Entomophthora muscae TaxID=34485 RepID=A0ACC2SL05_9FUNG|nr:hypothetical protein DSO57_1005192 [Entomophthora muscae]